MRNIQARLNSLERAVVDNIPPEPVPVLFANNAEDMRQAAVLDRQGKRHVVIDVINCRKGGSHEHQSTIAEN